MTSALSGRTKGAQIVILEDSSWERQQNSHNRSIAVSSSSPPKEAISNHVVDLIVTSSMKIICFDLFWEPTIIAELPTII